MSPPTKPRIHATLIRIELLETKAARTAGANEASRAHCVRSHRATTAEPCNLGLVRGGFYLHRRRGLV